MVWTCGKPVGKSGHWRAVAGRVSVVGARRVKNVNVARIESNGIAISASDGAALVRSGVGPESHLHGRRHAYSMRRLAQRSTWERTAIKKES